MNLPKLTQRFLTLLSLSACLVLSGCAAQVKPMMTPNGQQGYSVSCDGSADDWTSCYAAAANACKGKYTVIDRNESRIPTQYGPAVSRNLIVECRT